MDTLNSQNNDLVDSTNEPKTSWGGSWTDIKLNAFEKYVNAYLTIMNKNRDKYHWKLIYFDGFAGSGSRNEVVDDNGFLPSLFNECLLKEDLQVYKGAAERVLSIEQPGFDYYYFIDTDKQANEKLKEKLNRYKDATKKLVFRNNDANSQLLSLANAMKKDKSLKALVMLDPFGMQIKWSSIKQLAHLAVDLWILLPTGVIVNRLLDNKGDLSHIELLKNFFGMSENEIRNYFYKTEIHPSLFGDQESVRKIDKPIGRISELCVSRLTEIFDEVLDAPLILRNSRNCPIYHFTFASQNSTAKRIAKEIIGNM
ncbi:MAG: three-Cys-motif partner protein TcmP [Muribaculaceae bacterium]|jgi:three-Cys-motif partner protein|nr:three-Cys-motif partner protein TcmP [Muribaculaceae bacterium]